ncbi:hypothetical protein [Bradyrhizobium cenepequi]
MLACRVRRIKEAQRFYARNAVKTTLVVALRRSGRLFWRHDVITAAPDATLLRAPPMMATSRQGTGFHETFVLSAALLHAGVAHLT